MASLSRQLQRRILLELQAVYPDRIHRLNIAFPDVQAPDMASNMRYLAEHGLVTAVFSETLSDPMRAISAVITARGLDFLADDGGLSAILGVVTVKLHDDTIRHLLIERIEKADGAPSAKKALIDKIKGLPAEALGKLTMDGLDAALAQAPRLIELLSKLLS